MEKKQLATEWLMIRLYEEMVVSCNGNGKLLDELLEQVKQMEIENLIKARHDGIKYTLMSLNKSQGYLSDENYIKETFKVEK